MLFTTHNNYKPHRMAGAQMIQQLSDLFKIQNALLENNNPIKFKVPFTGKNHETLMWIFAAEKYLRIHDFKTPKIRFQRIFAAMHDNYQDRYLIDTKDDDDNLTFEKLKAWVLKEYPPPKTKYEFKQKLKSMLMYKNEDPNIAYARFKHKLAQINSAITLINEGLKAQSDESFPNDDNKAKEHFNETKMFKVSVEDRREALTRMFIIRNNKSKWNNEGVINGLVHKYLFRKDPRSMGDWDEAFKEMKTKLIPRILDGQAGYEYISYPVNEGDDSIYSKRHHQPNANDRSTRSKNDKANRKRGRNDSDQKGPTRKRIKRTTCSRCHRQGHLARDCYAERDINNNLINSPAPKSRVPKSPKPKCTICGGNNHKRHSCYLKDKLKNQQCHNCGKTGHLARACLRPKKSDVATVKNGFNTYPSQNKHQQQPLLSNPPEINVMSKPSDSSDTIDLIKQWANNSEMNDSVRNDLNDFINSINRPRK